MAPTTPAPAERLQTAPQHALQAQLQSIEATLVTVDISIAIMTAWAASSGEVES